jgi:putative ABC transport system permease protein
VNYLKRAWLSVTRKPGKSAILFGVILILGNVIAGAIAINQSTQNVEKQIKNQLGSFAKIELDYEMLSSNDGLNTEIKPLSEELIQQIGARSQVKKFDYLREGIVTVDKLKTFSLNNQAEDNGEVISESSSNQIHLSGTNLLKPLDFEEGTVNLTSGRFFNEEEHRNGNYVGIISEEFAQENGLIIGDTMTLDGQFVNFSADGESEKKKGNDYLIEIIGIFKNLKLEKANEQNESNGIDLFNDMPFNKIYLPNEAVKKISDDEHAGLQRAFPTPEDLPEYNYFTPQFILNQPEDSESFKEEVTPLLPNGYRVNASTDEYDHVGSSMNRLSQISSYVVLIAVFASLIIISLIIVLFTRDRKYELGIYLSLGERRKYVFAQIVIELLLIGISAMLISIVTGNLLGKIVSESLLSSSLLENNQASLDSLTSVPTIDQTMINNAFSVRYTSSYVATFLTTGIATILLSAILPLLYILRLNPKKIML